MWAAPPASLTCALLPNDKDTQRISGSGEGFGVKAGTALCLAGLCPGSAVQGEAKCAPLSERALAQLWEQSCRLAAPCWDFYVHISACTGCVPLCKPACVC